MEQYEKPSAVQLTIEDWKERNPLTVSSVYAVIAERLDTLDFAKRSVFRR